MDELNSTLVAVRADTGCFGRDVETMRRTMEDTLGLGAQRAGRAIEASLLHAAQSGKIGFEDLKRTALGALAEIAKAAIHAGMRSVLGGGGGGYGGGGGLGGFGGGGGGCWSLSGALSGLIGLPGRATGGPVAPGRGYLVGERGPELFVPTSSGRVDAGWGGGASGTRDVRVTIQVQAAAGEAAAALQRSSRQVARAVRTALAD